MKKVILLIFPLMFSQFLYSQVFNKPMNRYNENGLRTGKWISYWDEGKKVPMSKGNFKNGMEVGVCKEYHSNGKLRLKFRYTNDRIRVKNYSENRKLEQKGWSVIEYNENDTHYYWHGKWKFFDANRKLTRVSFFENGEEVVP